MWGRLLRARVSLPRRPLVAALGASLGTGAWLWTAQEEQQPTEQIPAPPPPPPLYYDYVLVGGGLASFMALHEITRSLPAPGADAAPRVLLIGDEIHAPYMRPPLSKAMWRSEASDTDLTFVAADGDRMSLWADPALGDAVAASVARLAGYVRSVDVANKTVVTVATDSGASVRVQYGKLLLATGLKAVSLSHVEPAVAPHVSTLRTLTDFRRVKGWWGAEQPVTVTVVGGGLLGSELAWTLATNNPRGHAVQWVCASPNPMAAVLPEYLAHEVGRRVRAAGVTMTTGHHAVGVVQGPEQRAHVVLDDGSTLATDRVVLALGAVPDNVMLARSGLEVDTAVGGVVANAELQVRSDIWAAGDVVSFFDPTLGRRRRVEHVDHASMSGLVAAKNMLGAGKAYDYLPVEFGSVAGMDWEGCGTLDSRLETFSVWEQPAPDAPATAAYSRGVVYYLDDDRSVVGVLTVNLRDKMDYAKRLVQYGVAHDNPDDTFKWIFLGQ